MMLWLACATALPAGFAQQTGPTAALLPFGDGVGDQRVQRVDDGSSGAVALDVAVPFFGERYSQLWVNTNGMLSFTRSVTTYTPVPFPWDAGVPLVAPFWADVDIRNHGDIFYRESIARETLAAAQGLVDVHANAFSGFQVEMAFVATWHEVAAFGIGTERINNTFQAVLMTDGLKTLVAFLYGHITWIAGTASAGVPAQVGFDAGDGKRFHVIPQSRTDAIVNLTAVSNTQSPGLLVFKVDGNNFGKVSACTAEDGGSLGVIPPHDGPFGGTPLRVHVGDDCFTNPDDEAACVFTMDSDEGYRGITPAIIIDANTLICHSHFSGRIGPAILAVSLDGGNSTLLQTSFYFSDSASPGVSMRINGAAAGGSHFLAPHDEVFEITFEPFQKSRSVDVVAAIVDEGGGTGEFLLVAAGVANNGSVRLRADALRNAASAAKSGSFVSAFSLILAPGAEESSGRRLLLPVVPFLFGLLTKAAKVAGSVALHTAVGLAGFATPPTIMIVLESQIPERPFWDAFLRYDFPDLGPIPCTEEAAIALGWPRDEACLDSGCPAHGWNMCYRQESPNEVDGTSGHQVCYDSDGELATDAVGAGTADRYLPVGFVTTVQHLWYDVIPWKILDWTGGLDLYIKHRPNPTRGPDGENCIETTDTPAAAIGDPHFVTLDGLAYTFNGAGEFWFLHTGNNLISVQIRLEKLYGEHSGAAGTVITALALRLASGKTVQVGFPRSSLTSLQILADGQALYFDAGLNTRDLGHGLSVSLNRSVAKVVARGLLRLEITAANGALGVIAHGGGALRNGTAGLLGVFDGSQENDLMARGGATLSPRASLYEVHHDFGLSWLVREEAESLFSYSATQSFEGFQDLDFEPLLLNVSGPEVNSTEAEVCGDSAACLFDLRVTGNRDFAASTRTQTEDYQHAVAQVARIEWILAQTRTTTTMTTTSSSTNTSTSTETTTSSSTNTSTTTTSSSTSTQTNTTTTSVTTTSATSSSSTSITSSTTSTSTRSGTATTRTGSKTATTTSTRTSMTSTTTTRSWTTSTYSSSEELEETTPTTSAAETAVSVTEGHDASSTGTTTSSMTTTAEVESAAPCIRVTAVALAVIFFWP